MAKKKCHPQILWVLLEVISTMYTKCQQEQLSAACAHVVDDTM